MERRPCAGITRYTFIRSKRLLPLSHTAPCLRLILHKAQDFHKGRFIFASFPVWNTLGFLQWPVFAGFPPILNAVREHGSIEFYRGLRINDSARFLNVSPISSARNEPSSFSTAGRPASPVSLNSGSNGS